MNELTSDWVTQKEAAAYLKVSIQTIRKWSAEGRLVKSRLSYRNARISSASIERMMERSQALITLRSK
jgi:excisionase family DNA binding protein